MIKIKYFVHATTVDNSEKRAAGWNEAELSEKGVMQAKALSKLIKDEYFDVVFCSDLKRAVDSANIDFEGRDIKIIQDWRIRECNYGDYNGKESSLIDYKTHINKKFPNGESLKDVEERVISFVSYLKENYDNKRIAIVAHRAPQLVLDVMTKDITMEEAIDNDWRNEHRWQPGWEYIIK